MILPASSNSVGQHHRLEGLAGILQVVTQTIHEGRLLHVGDPTIAPDDAHGWTRWGAREGVEGGMGMGRVRGGLLEGAFLGRHGPADASDPICIKVERPRGSRIDKLFGVGGELAWDLGPQGVQGEGQGLVLHRPRRGNGSSGSGGGTGQHPLRRRDTHNSRDANNSTSTCCRATTLLHLGGAELGSGKAGGGESDRLKGGPGATGKARGRLLL